MVEAALAARSAVELPAWVKRPEQAPAVFKAVPTTWAALAAALEPWAACRKRALEPAVWRLVAAVSVKAEPLLVAAARSRWVEPRERRRAVEPQEPPTAELPLAARRAAEPHRVERRRAEPRRAERPPVALRRVALHQAALHRAVRSRAAPPATAASKTAAPPATAPEISGARRFDA